jgi:cytochrome c-type biogenesis protein CcmE
MKRGYVIGGTLIALCAVTAAYSLSRAAISNVGFAEAEKSGEPCIIYGKLHKETVRMESAMKHVQFQLEEDRTGQPMEVLYDNPSDPVTANFASASHVRAVGTYDGQSRVFRATQLYTKCPSKYDSGGYKAEGSSPPGGRVTVPR